MHLDDLIYRLKFHYDYLWKMRNIYNIIQQPKDNKVVFLISHEDPRTGYAKNTGAPNMLIHLQNFYESHGISTIMNYLFEFDDIDIVSYIKDKSSELNCTPIVICNTISCDTIVKKLSFTDIPTYWYIHEWFNISYYDENTLLNISYLVKSSVTFIFICVKQYHYYLSIFSKINKYKIIYNGLDIEDLQNKVTKPLEKHIIKSDEDFFITIVGSINNRKNQQNFINYVFYKCKDKYPNVKLLLVGSCDNNIKLNIHPLYYDSIIMVGQVDNPIPYINMSDIIISYSTNEVFPLNILEAFYCKKSVISTNVGGISEIITSNLNGILVNNNDEYFNKLCKLIENKDTRRELGENGYNKCIEKYDINIVFKEFLTLL
jgi:glycosyltransferase involved in cell wall biosynthesis